MMFADTAVRAREANAKINLCLRVGARQADGLHEIESLITIVRGVSDRVISDTWDEHAFSMTGPFAEDLFETLEAQAIVEEQEAVQEVAMKENLAWRAAQAFDSARRQKEAVTPPLPLRLEKNLPFGAGFGGGSADAAAVLLLRAGEVASDLETLCALGAPLGADIPALLWAESANRPVWVSGSGTTCALATPLPQSYVVLAWPKVSLATEKVYDAFAQAKEKAGGQEGHPPTSPHSSLRKGQEEAKDTTELARWCAETGNHLAEAVAAVCPEAETLRVRLEKQKGCLLAQISGAGSGCFGLFARHQQAVRAAAQLRNVWATVGEIGGFASLQNPET